jgi:hypothetical protein
MNRTMVFKAGTWKNTAYTNADLQASVNSYNTVKVSAPWVVGHEIVSGDPAAGWVRSLEYVEDENKVGEIWANSDFNELGQKLLDEGLYENKSISFYPKNSAYSPNPDVHFVRHVALLGAEMPALSNLGPVAVVDFAADLLEEELLTYDCGCQNEKNYEEDSLNMTEYEMLKKMIEDLADKVKSLTEVETTEEPEAEPTNGPTPLYLPDVALAEESEPETSSEPDYKALYEKAEAELKSMRQNSASTSLAATVDAYYSEGVLVEEQLPAKDLILCLTKLDLGHSDFSETESPTVVINSLIAALRKAKPALEVPMGEETEAADDFSAPIVKLEDNELGDDFAMEAEKIAAAHGLSFSQGMSVLLSAQAFSAETGATLSSAVKKEVNRFKITK